MLPLVCRCAYLNFLRQCSSLQSGCTGMYCTHYISRRACELYVYSFHKPPPLESAHTRTHLRTQVQAYSHRHTHILTHTHSSSQRPTQHVAQRRITQHNTATSDDDDVDDGQRWINSRIIIVAMLRLADTPVVNWLGRRWTQHRRKRASFVAVVAMKCDQRHSAANMRDNVVWSV